LAHGMPDPGRRGSGSHPEGYACQNNPMGQTDPTTGGLRILVVDDEENIRLTLSLCLDAEGHHVVTAATVQSALVEVSQRAFDLIYLDLRLALDSGLDLIPRLLAENPWTKIVVITAYASVETAVEAMKRGAADYLPKPFTPAQVQLVTEKIADRRRLEAKVEALQQALGSDPEADFPTASAAMRRTLEMARRVAASSATVLVRGEVGVGKGRLARAIHAWSPRAAGAFGAVSCHRIPADTLEVELFGLSAQDAPHASPTRRGRVAFCEGGTLVLHEIADLPLSLQPKLLRLLHDKEYERVNDLTGRRADVRVLATTSVDLHEAARQGHFRPDLLLAVDVVTIEIPPLRDRPEDIRLLAERFLAHFARESGRHIVSFDSDVLDALRKHSYPGNVRELRNLIERAVLLCDGEQIGLEHLPPNLLNAEAYRVGDLVSLQKISDLHIRRVLASTRNYEAAASVLGINSITLWRRRKRYGLTPDEPKRGAVAPS
ncbi:MAG TPA: sigma-54 dependent transcriptional regulator, partial [Tepidisphaeraceae bacterium]|nr:sigma-54 dependent transcriptional regulator [Tepidisphaeraceae bacterium]